MHIHFMIILHSVYCFLHFSLVGSHILHILFIFFLHLSFSLLMHTSWICFFLFIIIHLPRFLPWCTVSFADNINARLLHIFALMDIQIFEFSFGGRTSQPGDIIYIHMCNIWHQEIVCSFKSCNLSESCSVSFRLPIDLVSFHKEFHLISHKTRFNVCYCGVDTAYYSDDEYDVNCCHEYFMFIVGTTTLRTQKAHTIVCMPRIYTMFDRFS